MLVSRKKLKIVRFLRYVRFLFYVTCTRAKNSLAVVMYTNNSEGVKTETIKKGWFEESEIIVM